MTRTARPIRLGVIGCGVIAFWTYLRELRRIRGAELAGAADPDPAVRAVASALAHIPVYETGEELLERDDIDAVVISAPTHVHAELAVAASEARKHFYLEKPLASNAEDARRVVAAAQRAGVTAALGFNRRFHPLFEQARSLIAAGEIGPVRHVFTAFCEPPPAAGMPQWRCRRATGGGVLLDLASHHIDLLRWFLNDETAEIDASLTSETTEDDTAMLRLTTTGGVHVQSFFSFRTGRADFLEFIGERGTLHLDRHRRTLSLRTARRWGYGVRSALVFPAWDVVAWWMARLLRPSYEPSYRRALTAFVEAVRGGATRIATLTDGVRSLETILAAEESARAGRPVAIHAR